MQTWQVYDPFAIRQLETYEGTTALDAYRVAMEQRGLDGAGSMPTEIPPYVLVTQCVPDVTFCQRCGCNENFIFGL
jgi:hypothetical protein